MKRVRRGRGRVSPMNPCTRRLWEAKRGSGFHAALGFNFPTEKADRGFEQQDRALRCLRWGRGTERAKGRRKRWRRGVATERSTRTKEHRAKG